MPFEFNLSDPTVQQVGLTLFVLVAIYLVSKIGQRLVPRYLAEPARQYRTAKTIGRAAAVLAFIVVVVIWSPGEKDLLTILTVIGAGLAIALRETVLSALGRFNIALRTLYRPGDRIEVNGIHGDVVDIRLLHTTMMETRGWVDADQSTGRLVHIPNFWVILYGVYNYSRGFNFIWNELPFTLTFRSDWQAARELILEHAQESASIVEQQASQQIRKMSREYLVHYSILTPFVYVRVVDNGVRLTLRYLCEVRKRRGTEHALTVSLLRAFREHGGIELAHQTVGVYPLQVPQFGPLPGRGDLPPDVKDR